jgi:RNA polymerase sigma-70 factor (ECF subfamily)
MSAADEELMRQVQHGRQGPFEELVRRHRPALLRVARSKLGDADWAEDVVQEAFLAAFAARHTYKPAFAFRTWLWTILLNLCRRQLKRRRNRPWELADALGQGEGHPLSFETGLSRLLRAERHEELAALLDALPEAQADALRLRFFGELPFQEIADAMGSSLSGAKVRVRKGLESLAEMIRQREARGEKTSESLETPGTPAVLPATRPTGDES